MFSSSSTFPFYDCRKCVSECSRHHDTLLVLLSHGGKVVLHSFVLLSFCLTGRLLARLTGWLGLGGSGEFFFFFAGGGEGRSVFTDHMNNLAMLTSASVNIKGCA